MAASATSRAATFAADERAANPIPLPGMARTSPCGPRPSTCQRRSPPRWRRQHGRGGAGAADAGRAARGAAGGAADGWGTFIAFSTPSSRWPPRAGRRSGTSDGPAGEGRGHSSQAGGDGARRAKTRGGRLRRADVRLGRRRGAGGAAAAPPAQGTLGPAGADEASSEAEAARGHA